MFRDIRDVVWVQMTQLSIQVIIVKVNNHSWKYGRPKGAWLKANSKPKMAQKDALVLSYVYFGQNSPLKLLPKKRQTIFIKFVWRCCNVLTYLLIVTLHTHNKLLWENQTSFLTCLIFIMSVIKIKKLYSTFIYKRLVKLAIKSGWIHHFLYKDMSIQLFSSRLMCLRSWFSNLVRNFMFFIFHWFWTSFLFCYVIFSHVDR